MSGFPKLQNRQQEANTAAKIYSTTRVGKKEGRVIRGDDKEAGNEQRTEAHARRIGDSPPSAPHQEPMGPFASLPPTRNKLILRTPS